MERIIKSERWSFDKHLVVLQRYEGDSPLRDLRFNRATFWDQVHDIPIRFMKKEVVENICDTIGEVIRSIGVTTEESGSFFSVRIAMDITQPLCRGRVITLENDSKSWVVFKYECLPNLCYWCRCLDHDDKDCELWIQSKGSLQKNQQQYGPSIRAPPFNPFNNLVIHVLGFYENRSSHWGKGRSDNGGR